MRRVTRRTNFEITTRPRATYGTARPIPPKTPRSFQRLKRYAIGGTLGLGIIAGGFMYGDNIAQSLQSTFNNIAKNFEQTTPAPAPIAVKKVQTQRIIASVNQPKTERLPVRNPNAPKQVRTISYPVDDSTAAYPQTSIATNMPAENDWLYGKAITVAPKLVQTVTIDPNQPNIEKSEEQNQQLAALEPETLAQALPQDAPREKVTPTPTCKSPQRGGSLAAAKFRSAAQLKAYGLTGNSVLATTKDGCNITVDAALQDRRISRLPFIPGNAKASAKLFENWKACLSINGFEASHYANPKLDKGLAFPPRIIRKIESGGYNCAVSYGRSRFSDPKIKYRIAHKLAMPKGDIGGALGPVQMMPAVAKAYGLTNPFDPAEAAHASARLSKDLQNRHGRSLTAVAAAYNAGSGAVIKARDKKSKKIILKKLPRQTRGYISAAYNAAGKRFNGAIAAIEKATHVKKDKKPKTLLAFFTSKRKP